MKVIEHQKFEELKMAIIKQSPKKQEDFRKIIYTDNIQQIQYTFNKLTGDETITIYGNKIAAN